MVEQATLATLPSPGVMRRAAQVMALLVGVDDHSKFTDRPGYSFRNNWRPGASLYHHDNYGGDHLWVVFTEHYGSLIVGFDHESDLNHFDQDPPLPPGVLDGVPGPLALFIGSPELALHEWPLVTFCLWRGPTDTAWRHSAAIQYGINGEHGDGADWMLGQSDMHFPITADHFTTRNSWALPTLPAAALQAVFDLAPLTITLIDDLIAAAPEPAPTDRWPRPTRDNVLRLALSIGYPIAEDLDPPPTDTDSESHS